MRRIVDDFWKVAALALLALTLAFLIGPLIVAISMSLDARARAFSLLDARLYSQGEDPDPHQEDRGLVISESPLPARPPGATRGHWWSP